MIERQKVILNLSRILETEYIALLGQRGIGLKTLIYSLENQTLRKNNMKFISLTLPRGMQSNEEFMEIVTERLIEKANKVPPENILANSIEEVLEKTPKPMYSTDFRLRKALGVLGKKSTANYLIIILHALAEAPETPIKNLLHMLRDYHNQRGDTGTVGEKLRFLAAGGERLWKLCCHKTADISPFNIAHRVFLDGCSYEELQLLEIVENFDAASNLLSLTDGIPALVEQVIDGLASSENLLPFFSFIQNHWNSLPSRSQENLKKLVENTASLPSCFPDYNCPKIPDIDSPWLEAFWGGFLRLEKGQLTWRSTIHKEFVLTKTTTLSPALEESTNTQPMPQEPYIHILHQRSILMLASSPINQARLRLDKEAREIDLGFQRAQLRDLFTLQQRWAVRPDDLRRALLDIKPQIVHFCGHGVGTAGLVLENDAGQAQFVPTIALTNLFKIFASRGMQCVVLNACYSEVQAEAISQHINYVVGISYKIGDDAAIKFAIGFYDALGAGWSYEEAYELGCNAIALEGIPEELTPVLKKR